VVLRRELYRRAHGGRDEPLAAEEVDALLHTELEIISVNEAIDGHVTLRDVAGHELWLKNPEDKALYLSSGTFSGFNPASWEALPAHRKAWAAAGNLAVRAHCVLSRAARRLLSAELGLFGDSIGERAVPEAVRRVERLEEELARACEPCDVRTVDIDRLGNMIRGAKLSGVASTAIVAAERVRQKAVAAQANTECARANSHHQMRKKSAHASKISDALSQTAEAAALQRSTNEKDGSRRSAGGFPSSGPRSSTEDMRRQPPPAPPPHSPRPAAPHTAAHGCIA
jgi:hypothetical protein